MEVFEELEELRKQYAKELAYCRAERIPEEVTERLLKTIRKLEAEIAILAEQAEEILERYRL